MKRIILVVLLVGIAGIAGIVRSHSKSGSSFSWPRRVHAQSSSSKDVHEEIRKSFQLSPGARVEVSGINGAVKIETSNTATADIFIERTADNADAMNRRKIIIEATADKLVIRGEKSGEGLMAHILGSNARENVTLKLPRQIALLTKGVNGAVKVGEIDGPVEVSGINGRVDIAQATGAADFSGINGSVSVALKSLSKGIDISGINGNIELRLGDGVNADLEAHGMNGRVISEVPSVVVDRGSRGNYSARIGSGGKSISASGINGNIRLVRMAGAEDRASASEVNARIRSTNQHETEVTVFCVGSYIFGMSRSR